MPIPILGQRARTPTWDRDMYRDGALLYHNPSSPGTIPAWWGL